MTVWQSINTIYNSNSYIVHEDSQALIIDIGDFEPILRYLKNKGLKVNAILLTHTHFDHIYGLSEFLKVYPDTFILTSSFGKLALENPKLNLSHYYGKEYTVKSERIIISENEEKLNIFNSPVKLIHTPGHDKSCISYIINNALFTGDSYIPGRNVIASFPNSNRIEALKWQFYLSCMCKEYILYPGHGGVFDYTGK